MKRLILFFLVFIPSVFLFACCENNTKPAGFTEKNLGDSTTNSESTPEYIDTDISSKKSSYYFEKATKRDFEKAKNTYNQKLLQDTGKILKSNGRFTLPLLRKTTPKFITFSDTSGLSDDSHEVYTYLGQFPLVGYYLVEGSFWEHSECYLIDKTSGQKTTTWDLPFLSKSTTYFANLSMAYGLEGIPNGIQIWQVKDQLRKIIEIDQQDWAPDDFCWTENDELILKVFPTELFWEKRGELSEEDFYYLKLKFDR